MNVNDIVALARAGFTAEQITRLYAAPAPVAAQPVAPAPVAAQPVAPAPVAAQPVAPAPVVTAPPTIPNAPVGSAAGDADPFAAIMREMGALRNAVQSSAIMSSNQPPAESVESILASIINPGTQSNAL